MLNQTDNEYLCRIGPNTPMGEFMRQYWMPAIRSDELPAPACPPVRIKLLGEELIGYRTTSGAVGLMQNSCPHRGASMFFGRNEEEGLRCVYHGWKFDVSGACVDMPSEPAESNFRNKVRVRAYQTHERNGIIWAYMGRREVAPPLPEIEANIVSGPEAVSILFRDCNWMQGLEGEMDTVHAAFLHYGSEGASNAAPGSFDKYHYSQRAAKFATVETEYGLMNGAYRPAEADSYYWRCTQILWPFYHMIPGGTMGEGVRIGAYVPMDDEHHLQWEIGVYKPDGTPMDPRAARRGIADMNSPLGSRRLPNGTGFFERHRSDQNLTNDFLINREEQSSGKTFTGIAGIRIQDCAVTETMGTIYNRSREHLGTTDAFIIRARRKLIAMAKNLQENGTVPPGVDNPEVYRQRSGEMVLPRDKDFYQAYLEKREAFNAAPVKAYATV